MNNLVDMVRWLVESGANVHEGRDNGGTPLFIAAERGHVEVVRLLLEFGAATNKAKKNGTPPLHAAVHLHRWSWHCSPAGWSWCWFGSGHPDWRNSIASCSLLGSSGSSPPADWVWCWHRHTHEWRGQRFGRSIPKWQCRGCLPPAHFEQKDHMPTSIRQLGVPIHRGPVAFDGLWHRNRTCRTAALSPRHSLHFVSLESSQR